jgi:transcription antitermination factor NusG
VAPWNVSGPLYFTLANAPLTGEQELGTQIGEAMPEQRHEYVTFPHIPLGAEAAEWFAVQIKPRHEKKAACELEEKGIFVFLPLYKAVHQWSDRHQEVQLPLFPNYVFVRISESRNTRAAVLQTNGVRSFVGVRGKGICIPDEEIEAIQKILGEKVSFTSHPFLNIGQKVRIRGGSLDGVCGTVMANNPRNLMVSIECIQRSLTISIDGYGVDPI